MYKSYPVPNKTMRVSDFIAHFMYEQGTECAFMLSGGGMMHLMDALGRSKIKYYCQHHEQSCAMAADAYARQSGQVGLAYVTSGPGATNAITGVVGAWLDSSPVVYLSGQSKVSQTIRGTGLEGLRQYGTFEVDICPIVKSITKYSAFLKDPKRVRYEIEKAYAIAREGRPGPVFIDVPVDVQGALINPSELESYTEKAAALSPDATVETMRGLIEKIKRAKKPVILAGYGVRVSNELAAFRRFAESINAPVLTTSLGIDALEYAHPLFTGHPAIKGDRAGNFAIQTADLIVSLGNSFHVMTTGYEIPLFAPKAEIVMVEADPMILKRQEIKIHQSVRSTVQDFLKAFLAESEKQGYSEKQPLLPTGEWLRRCQNWKEKYPIHKEPHKRANLAGGVSSINYYDLIESLSKQSVAEDTIVTDAGLAFYVIGQAFKNKRDQRVINSGGLGTMGFALPASTGTAAAKAQGRTICVTGDGSLQTNLHELAVLRQNNVNAKVFIVNNDGYVSIRNTQNNYFGGLLVGTSKDSGVWIPELEKVAKTFDLPYLRARTLPELEEAVKKTLATPGPVVCEIFTEREAEIIPFVTSVKRPDGKMESKALHDMYPFLSPEVLKAELPELYS